MCVKNVIIMKWIAYKECVSVCLQSLDTLMPPDEAELSRLEARVSMLRGRASMPAAKNLRRVQASVLRLVLTGLLALPLPLNAQAPTTVSERVFEHAEHGVPDGKIIDTGTERGDHAGEIATKHIRETGDGGI